MRSCVFILTHGRAQRVYTLNLLKRGGYTGPWYLLIDDEDEQGPLYKEIYGEEHVIVFHKDPDKFDTRDSWCERRVIVYARNAAYEAAKKLGYDCFLELDDDYTNFRIRYEADGKLMSKNIDDLDKAFDLMFRFLYETGADMVAMAQGGDLIGGAENARFKRRYERKAMNSLFCRVDKPIEFIGTMNEDVNTYTLYGSQGRLFFTFMPIQLTQTQTQSNAGGMTEAYLDSGTYLKSFYSVMCMPSAVRIALMGTTHIRIHHSVNWTTCVPKIINQKWKK